MRQPWTSRMRPWHWVVLDSLVAAWLTIIYLSIAARAANAEGLPRWVVAVILLSASLPIAVRRLWPLPVLGIVLAASATATYLSLTATPYIELTLVLYTVATHLRGRRSLLVPAAAVLVLLLSGLPSVQARYLLTGPTAIGIAMSISAWTIGVAVRQRREYAVTQRAEATQRAVTDERLRIARELHDVVAHGMSLIAVQAGVARYVVDTQPAEARRALESIEETSRSGLGELRRMLSTLRAPTGDAELEPAPSLASLDPLVERARRAGVPVTVEITGDVRPLPPGLELSAYRIIQESLTNVVKHAGPARATVTLSYDPEALRVEITDTGLGPSGGVGAAGHGLIGMKERVAVYDGELTAAPVSPHGFRVAATLPTGVTS